MRQTSGAEKSAWCQRRLTEAAARLGVSVGAAGEDRMSCGVGGWALSTVVGLPLMQREAKQARLLAPRTGHSQPVRTWWAFRSAKRCVLAERWAAHRW